MNLKDIAREAGVSAVTVSNVINGNYNKVSSETRMRVEKIIEEKGYRPNATARSLAMKKSKIICVIIPNLSVDDVFSSSPYYVQMLANLEYYIRQKGYYMMTRCVGKCGEVVELFSTWNVDGVIFLGAYDKEEDAILDKLKVPMVFVDSYTHRKDMVNVGIDDHRGGYLAAKYLLGMGHRQIAFAAPQMEESGVVRSRYNGFVEACEEYGVEITPEDYFVGFTFFEEGVRVGKQISFAKKKYTAVAAMSDVLAFGIMEGLRFAGKKVPQDVSIIGFDGIQECLYSHPTLTSIYQDMSAKSKKVADYLFQMIEEETVLSVNDIIDVDLKEGNSVIKVNS